MTTAPLDKYIKSPPPADERSHFNYLEEQFSKLENVSNKHVVRIAENNESAKALVLQESNARVSGDEAQATYTNTVAAQTLASAQALVNTEATARTTADSALASQITSLTATVGSNTAAITNEASLRVTADEALGTRIDNLVLTSGNDAAVIIDEEASARISADLALGTRIDSLTATVGDNTSTISTEQTTRSTRDDALAQQLFTMSSGSSRVYLSTTAPGSTGRQPSDVWFDTDDNYRPYVWARSTPTATEGDYDWRDNSNGNFTNLVGNYAVYTQAISTLTNTTTNQVTKVETLEATVGDSTAGLVRDVSALVTTVGGSSSGLVRDVSTLQSTTNQQRIFRQGTQPSTATADRKVGDLWFDTSNGNTPYYWNGTAWIANPDNTRATTAAITTEQTARTDADKAIAAYALTASAGTGRVYTSDPGLVSRQNGDVWFRVEENFRPYVWYSNQWNDNSNGAFTKYVGEIASVTQTATAAQDTANGLSYDWRVQGTIAGQPAGSIRLAGAQRKNPNTGQVETVNRLIIDADAQINGSLLVGSGFIDNTKIADNAITTAKIIDGAVTSSELANTAVTSAKIEDNAITTPKLLDSAITTSKINDGAVITNKLADNAITTVKLANGSVTALKMPDAVITGTKIADGAITTQKIAANAITANLINAGTITADKIIIGGIDTDRIAANAITSVAAGSNTSGDNVSTCSLTGIPNSQILFVASVDGSTSVSTSTLTLVMSIVINGGTVSYNTFPIQTLGSVTPVRIDIGNFYGSSSNTGFFAYGPLPMWNFAGTGMLIPRTGQVQYTNTSGSQIDFYCGVFSGNTLITVPTSIRVWQFKR